jgi:hypothetical protein
MVKVRAFIQECPALTPIVLSFLSVFTVCPRKWLADATSILPEP